MIQTFLNGIVSGSCARFWYDVALNLNLPVSDKLCSGVFYFVCLFTFSVQNCRCFSVHSPHLCTHGGDYLGPKYF